MNYDDLSGHPYRWFNASAVKIEQGSTVGFWRSAFEVSVASRRNLHHRSQDRLHSQLCGAERPEAVISHRSDEQVKPVFVAVTAGSDFNASARRTCVAVVMVRVFNARAVSVGRAVMSFLTAMRRRGTNHEGAWYDQRRRALRW